MLDLRALTYFVTVAEFKNFSKASAHLRIAQPALGRQVRKLEDYLGVKLLERSGRGMAVTDAGALLLERASVVLDQIEQIRAEITAHAGEPTGRLTIGVVPSAGQLVMPPLVERYATLFPKVSLNIVEAYTSFIEDGLATRRFDLGLLYDPDRRKNLSVIPLLHEPLYVIGPPQPTGTLPKVFELDEVARLPLLVASHPNSLRLLLDKVAAMHKIRFKIVRDVDSLQITKMLVQRGAGYTVMGYGSAHDEVTRKVLTATPIAAPEMKRLLTISRPAEQRRTNAITQTIRLIQFLAEELVATGVWRGTLPARPLNPAGTGS